jgi:hypothetical protein
MNTFTFTDDTDGNIFGGFTPLEWDAGDYGNMRTGDPSLKSFTFCSEESGQRSGATVPQNARIEALEEQFQGRSQHFQTQETSLEAAVVRRSQIEAEVKRESQAQESTIAALTDAIIRLSRIETQFAHTQSVSPPTAVTTPRIPEPVRTTPPSAKATGLAPVASIPKQTAATPIPALGSTIISDFPEIFAEFRGKRFALLWRGGLNGFRGCNFHSRCVGRSNALTLIEETTGNSFGRFTPLEWESRDWNGKNRKEHNRDKADANLKSFICDPKFGPYFRDIFVSDNPNGNTNSHTFLGHSCSDVLTNRS